MKNLAIASILLLSATSFAQIGNMPNVNTDQVNGAVNNAANSANNTANGAAAKANGAAAQANTQVDSAKATGNDKMAKGKQALDGLKVNVNTASKEDLAKLPGIGSKRADAIIANRPYTSAAGLTKVKGIGSATVSKIKDKISF